MPDDSVDPSHPEVRLEELLGTLLRIGVSVAALIVSVGAVLYEILTLTEPLRGQKVQDTFNKIVSEMPELPAQRAPNRRIPPPLANICMKALAKKPEDRFQTMREFISAIRAYRGKALVSAEQRV